jgi:cardiolipin synthase
MNSQVLSILSILILAAHWIIMLGLAARVIMRRVPVGVSLAWLTIITSMPFIGAGAYILFGENRLGRGRSARTAAHLPALNQWQKHLRLHQHDTTASAPDDAQAIALRCHAERTVGFPALAHNKIELLDNFTSVFDSLVADIDAAREKCHLCFYIWHEHGRTDDVVDALIRAAKRGVDCRALADAVGSKAFLEGDAIRRLRAAGVTFTVALPAGLWRTLFIRRDLRNHRKIVVIDDTIAYTGSQNLVDPRYFKQNSGVGEWVDAIVRVTGPTAACLDTVFEFDWAVESGTPMNLPVMKEPDLTAKAESLVQVVPSGPDLQPEAIHQLILTAIYSAREKLVMTTPYFVPDDTIITALLSAAQRGVLVTLIVPAKNDSLLVRYASVSHFDDLMSAGVHIRLFEGGLLHTKSLVVDDSISIFGSVNFDMRSLWLNFEISLFVYDRDFTSQLKNLQQTYLGKSTTLDLETWRQRPLWQLLAENTLRLIGPLL